MSLAFPTSRIFVKVVVNLLLPYHFVYKTHAYIFNTGFVLNSCLTVTLVSKRI